MLEVLRLWDERVHSGGGADASSPADGNRALAEKG
jgi:hypothetical protein